MSPNLKNKIIWLESRVIAGKGLAKTLGFPTINLHNPEILKGKRKGVYLCRLLIDQKQFFGLLYYGPRLVLGEENDILEIYVIDFLTNIYGKYIKFQLIKYLRGVLDFKTPQDLKKQINKDFSQARKLLSTSY